MKAREWAEWTTPEGPVGWRDIQGACGLWRAVRLRLRAKQMSPQGPCCTCSRAGPHATHLLSRRAMLRSAALGLGHATLGLACAALGLACAVLW